MAADLESVLDNAVVIVEVMESFPLQLRVSDGAQEHMVDLDDAVQVQRGGEVLTPGALAPGQRVSLELGGPAPQVVQRIEIQDK